MSKNLFNFTGEGAFKKCSFAFISFLIISLFLIPLSSAVEIKVDPAKGVVINPFVSEEGRLLNQTFINSSYYNFTNYTMYNETYHTCCLTWSGNYSLYYPFWYNYSLYDLYSSHKQGGVESWICLS